jgi:hypothetical protein
MEVLFSSESSVHVGTTWRYIAENENIEKYAISEVKKVTVSL